MGKLTKECNNDHSGAEYDHDIREGVESWRLPESFLDHLTVPKYGIKWLKFTPSLKIDNTVSRYYKAHKFPHRSITRRSQWHETVWAHYYGSSNLLSPGIESATALYHMYQVSFTWEFLAIESKVELLESPFDIWIQLRSVSASFHCGLHSN